MDGYTVYSENSLIIINLTCGYAKVKTSDTNNLVPKQYEHR